MTDRCLHHSQTRACTLFTRLFAEGLAPWGSLGPGDAATQGGRFCCRRLLAEGAQIRKTLTAERCLNLNWALSCKVSSHYGS